MKYNKKLGTSKREQGIVTLKDPTPRASKAKRERRIKLSRKGIK